MGHTPLSFFCGGAAAEFRDTPLLHDAVHHAVAPSRPASHGDRAAQPDGEASRRRRGGARCGPDPLGRVRTLRRRLAPSTPSRGGAARAARASVSKNSPARPAPTPSPWPPPPCWKSRSRRARSAKPSLPRDGRDGAGPRQRRGVISRIDKSHSATAMKLKRPPDPARPRPACTLWPHQPLPSPAGCAGSPRAYGIRRQCAVRCGLGGLAPSLALHLVAPLISLTPPRGDDIRNAKSTARR